jgi:hypothetical protein
MNDATAGKQMSAQPLPSDVVFFLKGRGRRRYGPRGAMAKPGGSRDGDFPVAVFLALMKNPRPTLAYMPANGMYAPPAVLVSEAAEKLCELSAAEAEDDAC